MRERPEIIEALKAAERTAENGRTKLGEYYFNGIKDALGWVLNETDVIWEYTRPFFEEIEAEELWRANNSVGSLGNPLREGNGGPRVGERWWLEFETDPVGKIGMWYIVKLTDNVVVVSANCGKEYVFPIAYRRNGVTFIERVH